MPDSIASEPRTSERAMVLRGSLPRRLLLLTLLAGVYFAVAKSSLSFASINASASAVWPPTGITLAAFLLLGYDIWPAVLIGAFLANLATQGSVATSIGIGIGNTLEGLLGAYLVSRFAGGRLFFARARGVFIFAGLAAIVSTTVSASIGVTSLALAGFASWASYGPVWLTWWLGDAAGDLIVAPFLVLWCTRPHVGWQGRWPLEGAAVAISLSTVALIVFTGLAPAVGSAHLSLEFLCVPFLFWAAFRLGRRAVATSMLGLSCIAVWGTLHGLGPFARAAQNDSLLLLQAYLAVQSITTLAVAAVVWEYRQSDRRLREQAAIDSLTGLPNFRALMGALIGEVNRSQRSNGSFSLLLLDLDHLKDINDQHGHLAGNRAICRVADALRSSTRASDTVARFGGDEFAVVLPETLEPGARQLAGRLADFLGDDQEQPPVSASVGVAVYPRDGATAELLLRAADAELYRAKAARGGGRRP